GARRGRGNGGPRFAPRPTGSARTRDRGRPRRSVLRMTTAVAGLALAPTRAGAEPAGPSPAMAALSAYMSEAAGRALPADVAEQAKHHLIDTLAAMISGSHLPPGQAAARHVMPH